MFSKFSSFQLLGSQRLSDFQTFFDNILLSKLKISAKQDIFGSWVIKYQIGSDFRPTCSQNSRSLASKTTKIWVVFWIPLRIRNFHKIKKIRQTRHFVSWVIKCQIGSDLRPTCSQNFRSLASKTTKIWVVFWILSKIRNFHKIKKIRQTRHFW